MTTKVLLTNVPQQIVNCENWALLSTTSGESFKIHVGAAVTDPNAYHLVREIGFGIGVSVWAWNDTASTIHVDVSQG